MLLRAQLQRKLMCVSDLEFSPGKLCHLSMNVYVNGKNGV